MKIQSLSIVVPNPSCVNNCEFCCAHMHCDTYEDHLNENLRFFDLYLSEYLDRLKFARDNQCNTVMLTGRSEPQQNRKFLAYFGMFQKMLDNPFRWVEMQTTGVLLDEGYLRFLRNHVRVNVISLSISSLDSATNCDIIRCPEQLRFNLEDLCKEIKRYDFTLRFSLNLTAEYDAYASAPKKLFERCREMGADQVTLRVLYSSGNGTKQDAWVQKHAAPTSAVDRLTRYIRQNGVVLGVLPHGAVKYSLDGLCVVIDADCMDKATDKSGEDYKYLVLQPDCKLYSQWDDPASRIF